VLVWPFGGFPNCLRKKKKKKEIMNPEKSHGTKDGMLGLELVLLDFCDGNIEVI